MRHRAVMIGSDGLPTLDGKPHPRLYNSFARVIGHYARDRGLFALETAIRRMTGFSAEKFGLVDRGRIREGAFADLVVFDADAIIDAGTYANPNQYPLGIKTVIVNGVVAIDDDRVLGVRAGRVLGRGARV
jgi:N-acyl-D-amino-acid deacylase